MIDLSLQQGKQTSMLENDQIVCVLFYPLNDQAEIALMNTAFARQSTEPNVQRIFQAVQNAMKDPYKSLAVDFVGINEASFVNDKCWVDFPCFVSSTVTLYEDE